MKIIGLIRDKKDIEKYGDIEVGYKDTVKLKDMWEDNESKTTQTHFPAILFKFDGSDVYGIYNKITYIDKVYEDILKEQEEYLLQLTLFNCLYNTVYSSADDFVDMIADRVGLYEKDLKEAIVVLVNMYNKFKMEDKGYTVELYENNVKRNKIKLEFKIEPDMYHTLKCKYIMHIEDELDKRELFIDIVLNMDELVYKRESR